MAAAEQIAVADTAVGVAVAGWVVAADLEVVVRMAVVVAGSAWLFVWTS